jgi:hypothetical protein
MKVWNFSDQDDREIAACIQARIGVPRAYLSPERLQAALQKFDPSKPVWRTNRRLRPLGSKAKFCTVWKRLLGFAERQEQRKKEREEYQDQYFRAVPRKPPASEEGNAEWRRLGVGIRDAESIPKYLRTEHTHTDIKEARR